MPKAKIDATSELFVKRVKESLGLAKDALNFQQFKSGNHRPIRKSRLYLIIELSFLQLFISWEQYLEQIFILFMCGVKTPSGYLPKIFTTHLNQKHALEIVNRGRPYSDWSSPGKVIQNAKLYFENGEPFTSVLGASSSELEGMRIMRHAIAHRSKHSTKKFQNLVRQKLGYTPRVSPGKYLLYKIPVTETKNMIQKYGEFLLILDEMIARRNP